MIDEQFKSLCQQFLEDATSNIMAAKGREYAGNEDRLSNFKRGAAACGVKPETILYVYVAKHWDSFSSFIRDLQSGKSLKDIEASLSEPIEGRLKDIVNYCLLAAGLIQERRINEAFEAANKK